MQSPRRRPGTGDQSSQVAIGDELNEIMAEAKVGSAQEAAEWLRAAAVQHYPASTFARLYPDPIADGGEGFV
jgi:disulfide oxidoreductase YuzD